MRNGDESKHHLIMDVIVVDLNVLPVSIKGGVVNDEDGFFFCHNEWALEEERCEALRGVSGATLSPKLSSP